MTVAIYQKTPEGMLRLGTFTVRRYTHSVRAIGEQFLAKHPHFDPATLYIASRSKVFGQWVDGERLPFKLGAENEARRRKAERAARRKERSLR